jgi:carbonic anhydrase
MRRDDNGRKDGVFDDIIEANAQYRQGEHISGLTGRAMKGLGIVTCIDTRLDPLAMLGLSVGDSKIIRNAGARVTDDALRSLALATNLLGVNRVAVIQHTRCAMIGQTDDEVRKKIADLRGVDTSGWDFGASLNQSATLAADLQRVRDCELLPPDLTIAGFVFDVDTGEIVPFDDPTG